MCPPAKGPISQVRCPRHRGASARARSCGMQAGKPDWSLGSLASEPVSPIPRHAPVAPLPAKSACSGLQSKQTSPADSTSWGHPCVRQGRPPLWPPRRLQVRVGREGRGAEEETPVLQLALQDPDRVAVVGTLALSRLSNVLLLLPLCPTALQHFILLIFVFRGRVSLCSDNWP